jgi:hypothetical protein
MLEIMHTGKQSTCTPITFLLSNFMISFITKMIVSISLAIILVWYLVPQQQAIAASSMNVIATSDSTDTINLKPSIENNINNNNNFVSFQDRAFGIVMQYPSLWQKIDGESQGEGEVRHIGGSKSLPDQASSDDPVVEFVSPLAHSSDMYQETLSISVHKLHTKNIGEFFRLFDKPTSQKILLHGFVLSHITSLIAKLPSFNLIKSESGGDEITLSDGTIGRKIVYTYMGQRQISSNSNTQLKVMEVLIVKNDIGYIIRYTSEPNNYYSYLPTTQKMINSFRITADKKS